MHHPIIAHCHLRWDFVWQRPQHILSRLAANHRILVIEEPEYHATSQPTLRLVEATTAEGALDVVRAIPMLPEPLGIDNDAAQILPLLRVALDRHPLLAGAFDDPIQWFYSPMSAPSFIGQLGEIAVVYDCMDELANFRFAPPDIAERERFLLAHADIVFTGGRQLFEAKSRLHRNVHFFGCGVDVEHFGAALKDATPVAAEVAKLERPVLGYFGVIDERLDYELIGRLAAQFPQGSVVMVGPVVKVDPAELPQAPNLHWLGQRSYKDLPLLVKGFDICLMPFAMNDATRYINPTKTLEYLAAGKPVVSTAVPDVVRNFSSVVAIAHSHDDFVRSVREIVESPNPTGKEKGLAFAHENTWESIVAAMRSRMLEAVSQPAKAAA